MVMRCDRSNSYKIICYKRHLHIFVLKKETEASLPPYSCQPEDEHNSESVRPAYMQATV